MTTARSSSLSTNGMQPGAPRRGRILIVDDRPDKLLMLESALAPLGREIVAARSGSEALRRLLQQDFTLILLDMNMPGMDGFETAQRVRQRRRNRDTPIMFVTSYGDDMQALQGYAMGAVDFIVAPVVPEVLRSKAAVFLELYDRTEQVREQAEELLARTRQLQELTRASLRIHAAPSAQQTFLASAECARNVLAARQAWALAAPGQLGVDAVLFAASGLCLDLERDLGAVLNLREIALSESKCAPFGRAELASCLAGAQPGLLPEAPFIGLAAPLIGRTGDILGALLATDENRNGPRDQNENVLVQLAQMTATAVDNTRLAEAREANRLKDEFLATLSHELRTPLSSILGWAQLLRTQMLDAEETAEALEIIERNSQMQCKLIEELLDVSRIVTGKMQLHMRPVELQKVIHAAVSAILPAASAKQIAVDVVTEGHSETVAGDAERLQQVFLNVLSNAVKFTPLNGHVEVRVDAAERRVRVAVRDDGEGIAPEFLPHVFDRFRQADSSTSRKHGGLGIGLAIVRHVVELHGGSVRAESEGKGRGTTIVVTLPVVPGEGPAVETDECLMTNVQ